MHSGCIVAAALLYSCRSLPVPWSAIVYQLWPVVLICLVPFMYLLRRNSMKETRSIFWQAIPSLAAIMFVLCAGLAYPGAFLMWCFIGVGFGCLIGTSMMILLRLLPSLKDQPTLWCTLMGALWVTLFWGVSHIVGSYFLLSTPLATVPYLIQPLSLVGVYVLEFLSVCLNAAIACAIFGERKPLVVFGGIWSFWIFISLLQYFSFNLIDTPIAKIGLVQGPVNYGEFKYPKANAKMWQQAAVLRRNHKELDVIVFPEYFIDARPETTKSGFKGIDDAGVKNECVKQITQAGNKYFPAGIERPMIVTGCRAPNQGVFAVVWHTDGKFVFYGKERPMVLVAEVSNHRTGHQKIPIKAKRRDGSISDAFFAPLICFDVDFPDTFAAALGRGVGMVIAPSGDWSQVRDHYLVSVIRAIEFRVSVVKADSGHDSAVVSPRGDLLYLTQTKDYTISSKYINVSFNQSMTLFMMSGVYTFPILCACFVLFMIGQNVLPNSSLNKELPLENLQVSDV